MQGLKINTNHILYITTGSLLFLLSGLFIVNLLHPFTIESSYADSKDVDTMVGLTETLPLPDVSADSIVLSLEPNADGDFASAEVTVGVSTNHVSGYTLTLSTEGTNTDLTHDSSNDYKITALSSKTSATDFANLSSTASINKWGFTTDNNGDGAGQTESGYYYAVTDKDNPTTIKVTNGPANVSDTKVTFATKGKDLAAGTYSNTVVFTTIANAIRDTRSLDDFEYMQDVDADGTAADICENSTSYSDGSKQYTLKDSRDNEEYVIRKLKDGNCWMTSNLRLRGENLASGVSTTLNSTNTDLTSGSTFVLPSSATWTSTSTTNKGLLYSGNTNAKIGSSKTAAVSGTQAQARGTYYTWCTATANCDSAAAAGGSAQPNSICPKGWKLPNSDGTSTDTNQFYKLYNLYSGSSQYADFMSAYNYYYNNGAAYYLAGNWYTGGYVDGSGTGVNWWSSTPHSSNANQAWDVGASASSVYPANYILRYVGLTVRCVLAGS